MLCARHYSNCEDVAVAMVLVKHSEMEQKCIHAFMVTINDMSDNKMLAGKIKGDI